MIDMTLLPAPVAVLAMGGASACPISAGTAEFRGTGVSTLQGEVRAAAVRLRKPIAGAGTPRTYDPNVQTFDPTLGIHSPGRPL